VSISLAILAFTAALQIIVFVFSGSVALLADLIHNGGDALTAIPLAIAFLARSERGERWAGYAVVLTIFASAAVAAGEAVDRLVHPQHLDYLGPLALAGLIGFAGNELAARVRLRAGARLDSPALIADGHHARIDGFVSLGVIASAAAVGLGVKIADPLIGLAITVVILRITWQAWQTVRSDQPVPPPTHS
jgi:cation diffusion facilitator family transporter